LQKPLKAMADLFMGEIFALIDSFLAALNGLHKAGFFLEIARKNALQKFVRLAALPGSGVGQFRFEFMPDIYFHRSGSL
jgi:hypothetical protein